MIEEENLLGKVKAGIIEIQPGIFRIVQNNKSYSAEVIKADREEKTFALHINGKKYSVKLQDRYDELLEQLGMNSASSLKIKELKAPMPGLVLEIKVREGDVVKQGEGTVILQAMKMENILKAPADASVKKVFVKKGDAVEKNQILISFGS